MSFFATIRATSAAVVLCASAAIAETRVLKAAVLEFGTVNWELDSIKHNGFDTANGFELEVQGVAGGSAAKVAFQGGEADGDRRFQGTCGTEAQGQSRKGKSGQNHGARGQGKDERRHLQDQIRDHNKRKGNQKEREGAHPVLRPE